MFEKILIANRGEIACRVAATARRMGVKTVAVYSDADAHAKHVLACDEAVHIGGNAPAESYLQWQRIIDAAKATGAQAIHPGYGFLSENEAFAHACADAGVVFIGPPASAIQAMGLKAESKRLMAKAGVPLVPGYQGEDQDPQLLQREADQIGYPVLIKASAGGGGKGMREVFKSEDFADALASCKREAANSFANDAVLIEKLVQQPRHIEIQIFGDTQGNYVYLFERDCSTQRRHQKVLEEAPAPGMTPELRRQMGEAAVAAARAVGYVGAGTVEFIVEQPGGYAHPEQMQFYFMEMNTRLQVEHPVTEAISGQDLVEWQLRVAAGQPLPLAQEQLVIHGHAIEARICAENPDKDFLPATGTLHVYRKPAHVAFEIGAVRFDDGVREGDAISPYYDSMIAKLIVHGKTRQEALARLDAALAATHIAGLQTNVQFLRHLLATASFRQARLDTALIPREADHLFNQDPLGRDLVVAAAVAQTVLAERAAETFDPFSRTDGFRSHGVATRRVDLQYQGEPVVAKLRYLDDGLQLQVGDSEARPLSITALPDGRIDLRYGDRRELVQVHALGEEEYVFATHGAARITELDMLSRADEGAAEGGRLTAPMPGKVVSIAVQAGDKVTKGQALAVMEAMKMEHTIAAPQDGVVQEVLYAPGDQVAEGDELLRLGQPA
ncbi:acetyl/propionyl/methylcrotonyl-CoA carboxylase subunit alpha [Comamonas flocculans]|uniref:Acetyl/propionyl/methylcrotonyl-CoA carboxylase subunit alpha n=1 Tax=Comamonas flocculans TaxID=2597701 RepID=A0A5B8RSD2_9BURK|nr:acetyl/propionyl/methylcrotonyl-CoA carboxylase subunit alpha [Comamonas flocculans]QEA12401.1 acetyl/propionyl/methylcrotonyl-CoA carboxylase subunit alpha [Comamonas flocculans]